MNTKTIIMFDLINHEDEERNTTYRCVLDPTAPNNYDVSRWELFVCDALGTRSWQTTHVGGGLGMRSEAMFLAKLARGGSVHESNGLTTFNIGTIDYNDLKPRD